MAHQPFIVEINLLTPVVWQHTSFLTLDALLAAALYHVTGDIERAHSEIPLERTGALWHGSAMFLVDPVPGGARFTADLNPVRGDVPEYVEAPKKLLRTGGPNKPQIDLYPGYDSPLAIWFGCGDITKVSELLGELQGIGKKVNQGYGQIRAITVRPLNIDRSFILPDGTPARPVPAEVWEALDGVQPGHQDVAALSPPYWRLQGRGMLCHVPVHRSLSLAHIQHIESGVSPQPLPASQSTPAWLAGMDFFYQHIGQAMQSAAGIEGNQTGTADKCDVCGVTEGLARAGKGYTTLCPVCYAFAGQYQGIKRPGRMGAGWMGVVSPSAARLVTSVEYAPKDIPLQDIPNLSIQSGKDKLSAFLHSLVTEPPEPPFLAFISDNSSVKVARNLTVSWSHERMYLCGADLVLLNAVAVQEALALWRQSGLPINKLAQACHLYHESNTAIDTGVRSRAQGQWEKLLDGLKGAAELVPTLPVPGTAEFDYFARLARWETAEQ